MFSNCGDIDIWINPDIVIINVDYFNPYNRSNGIVEDIIKSCK